jgi:hypothetical protein
MQMELPTLEISKIKKNPIYKRTKEAKQKKDDFSK